MMRCGNCGRIPVHMSYNVTAIDRDGRRATVYLAPDRPAQVTSLAVATNYQGTVEWAPYAAAIRTVERQEHLERTGGRTGRMAPTSWRPACSSRCTPPVSVRASGPSIPPSTRPAEGIARYHWPQHTWEHSLRQLGTDRIDVRLGPA